MAQKLYLAVWIKAVIGMHSLVDSALTLGMAAVKKHLHVWEHGHNGDPHGSPGKQQHREA